MHDARGYNAYGQQRVSPFRLDQIMPRRYADDGGARSDGGRTAPPTYVHAPGWDDSFSNLAEAHNGYNRRMSLV